MSCIQTRGEPGEQSSLHPGDWPIGGPEPSESGGGAPVRRVPELALVELGVVAASGEERGVVAALDDLAGLDHQDQIGVLDRAQAVCDDDAGASTQQPAERYLDPLLGARVDTARRLVEDQDAGVSPTDAKIRGVYVQALFRLPPDAVLGFEAAGVVDAIGPSVSGVNVGDNVASLLAGLGGYAEYVLASSWTPKPANVSWSDAAALPVAAEAALGILKQLRVVRGETLLILGAAGSVGMIAASYPTT